MFLKRIEVFLFLKVVDDVLEEESCDEIGEDYCLMRKTVAAHVDYIYTDSQKP